MLNYFSYMGIIEIVYLYLYQQKQIVMISTVNFEGASYRMAKCQKSFMVGNKDIDGLVYDVVSNVYSQREIIQSDIDFENAIYSDGYIKAIKDGLTPILKLHTTIDNNGYVQKEYHHIIIGDECYKMYFQD
jgi:hypothetical protein